MSDVERFVLESWEIEGLNADADLQYLADLHLDFLHVGNVEPWKLHHLASTFTGRGLPILRTRKGMDVRVGDHVPPPGGPGVEVALSNLVYDVNRSPLGAYDVYLRFETLHPFLDGNGRVGRLLWAWCMRHKQDRDRCWLSRGFLKTFHYQALGAWDGRQRSS